MKGAEKAKEVNEQLPNGFIYAGDDRPICMFGGAPPPRFSWAARRIWRRESRRVPNSPRLANQPAWVPFISSLVCVSISGPRMLSSFVPLVLGWKGQRPLGVAPRPERLCRA